MKSVSAEKVNINEYIKSKLKAFVETFATLGEILGGTSSASKLTDAEKKVEAIWEDKDNKESKEAIEALEARETIPEKGEVEKKRATTKKNNYGINKTVQQQETIRGISKNRIKTNETKTIDDDYVK